MLLRPDRRPGPPETTGHNRTSLAPERGTRCPCAAGLPGEAKGWQRPCPRHRLLAAQLYRAAPPPLESCQDPDPPPTGAAAALPPEEPMAEQVPFFGTDDLAINPEPRLPCVLLLDVSG